MNTIINPVWDSLCETQKHFSIDYEGVKFYNPEICPFGAFTDTAKTAKALNKYAQLTDNFFLVSENKTPLFDKKNVTLIKKIDGIQMVLENSVEIEFTEEIIPLTKNHIDEIYHLIWQVMPGYYKRRSFEMGKYFGIFKDAKLVSIAGQRMQSDSWVEISGVVTHPNFTKKGLAKQLTAYVAKEIIKDGKHPILHATKGNSAIKLYEGLGFILTREMNWWYFNRK